MIASVDHASLQRLLLLPAEFRQAAIQGGVIVARIIGSFVLVGDERADRIGQFVGGDQVLAPERERIETEVARHHVEEALAKEIRLDASGRTIGPGRRLVGHHRGDLDADMRKSIRPEQKLSGLGRDHARIGADIGAHVGMDAAAQSDQRAVLAACDLHVAVDFARMIGREQMLATVLDPAHGAFEPPVLQTESRSLQDKIRRARRSHRPRRLRPFQSTARAGRACGQGHGGCNRGPCMRRR